MIYYDKNNKAIIDSMVGESKKTIICGGLGGGFGSVFISNFSSENKDVYSYVLFPANYESENRKKNAKHALMKIENSGAQFLLWDMEDILMKNFNYLENNELFTSASFGAFCVQLVSEKILKDVEQYL